MSDRSAAAAPLRPLMRDFLRWVEDRPRTYADAMAAWRSSCPRYTIWEDALEDRLVRVEHESGIGYADARVVLTAHGRALLKG